MKSITHGRERFRLSCVPMGRYVINWGEGGGLLGLQRGGSSMKFWSNGKGDKAFKSLKVRGGSCS